MADMKESSGEIADSSRNETKPIAARLVDILGLPSRQITAARMADKPPDKKNPDEKDKSQPANADAKAGTSPHNAPTAPLGAATLDRTASPPREVKPDPFAALTTDAAKQPVKPARKTRDTIHVPAAGRSGPVVPSGVSGQMLDRKAAYRKWLESKSKDDLINLIIDLDTTTPGLDITEKMIAHGTAELKEISAETYKVPDDMKFLQLPAISKDAERKPGPAWRIVLLSMDPNFKPVGLRVDGEITIGRTMGDAAPDLDLLPYGGSIKGVSRLQARLRPTETSLELIDLKSTNGTFCNKVRLTPDTPVALKDGDIVVFGRASFVLKVVEPPKPSS